MLARLIADYQPEKLPEAVSIVETMVLDEPSFPKRENRVWPTLLGWKLCLGDSKGASATITRGYASNSKGSGDRTSSASPIEAGITEAEKSARTTAIQEAVDFWLGREQLPAQTRVSFKLLSGQVLAAKKLAGAVRLLRQLREESPRDAQIARILGLVLFEAGEFRESLQEWNSLVAGLPQGREDWLTAIVEALSMQP